jgi:hypothetical protein
MRCMQKDFSRSLFADGIASYKVMVIACLVICQGDFVLALGKETDKSGTRSMNDEYLSWIKNVATDSGWTILIRVSLVRIPAMCAGSEDC